MFFLFFCLLFVYWEDKYHFYSSRNDLEDHFSSCKHFSCLSLFPFMDISWWIILVWVTFFSFIVLGPWCIFSVKKAKILLLWNVYLYYYYWYFDTLLPALRFFLNFYFWNSFYLLSWLPKILNFSLFFRASFTLCSTSKNIFSNFIFKLSFIFLLSYFKFLRILHILNCSFHQDVGLYCCLVKSILLLKSSYEFACLSVFLNQN